MLERLTSCGTGEPVAVLRSVDDDVAPAQEGTVRPVVIVAGAGPGIGTSIARRFGAEGFGVALLARNSARLSAQQAELAAAGVAAEAFIVDHLRPVAERRSDMPTGVCRLINRWLEKEPRDRVQTATEPPCGVEGLSAGLGNRR